MATLLVSAVASSAQDVAAGQDATAGPDLVVIGRRMRLVRLDYALNGPHLRRCNVEKSSGDARVDRIMCTVLRRCITAGYREPRPATRCMDATIDLFVSGERHPPEPDPVGAAISPMQPRSLLAPNQTSIAPAARSGGGSDIVVTGERNPPIGGRWRFTRLNSPAAGRLSQSQWGRCIPDGGLEAMLRMMLNGEATRGAGGQCGPMKLKVERGRLTGDRSCLYGGTRMKTMVRGSVSQDRILADETTYLVASASPHVDDSVRVPEDDRISRLYGERVGVCSTTDQTGDGQ